MTDVRAIKLSIKFGISLEAADGLVSAGFDNVTKVKAASNVDIEEAAGSEALSIIRQRYAEPE